MAIVYNTYRSLTAIFRATGGGSVYSGNLAGSSNFDYFDDAPAVNDAVYFGLDYGIGCLSNIKLYIGTPMSGVYTLVWEYSQYYGVGAPTWEPVPNLVDNSSSLTLPGERIVEFPPLPAATYWNPGGGLPNYCLWVRCRLSAITSITEGGAQSTQTVQAGDGIVEWTGYTDSSPLTPDDLYNWFSTYHPTVGCVKVQKQYHFPVYPKMSSRLRILGESVAFGSGSSRFFDLSYLQIGSKTTTGGQDNIANYGYLILYNGYAGGNYTTTTTNTKVYGGRIVGKEYYYNGKQAYIGWQPSLRNGEYIETNCGPYPVNISTSRCSVRTVYGTSGVVISDSLISDTALYSNNTLTAINCKLATGNSDFPVTVPNSSINPPASYTFIDSTRLPEKALSRYSPVPGETTPNAIKVYDAGTGTYTDYTSQVDGVPLYGGAYPKEGDIVYLGFSTVRNTLRFVIDVANEDNIYDMEYYYSGNWQRILDNTYGRIWDLTNGFAESGKIYHQIAYMSYGYSPTTIDGYYGYWLRFRIAQAGSSRPRASHIYVVSSFEAVCDCKVYEKFTLNVHVTDQTGNDLQSATVKLYDKNDQLIFSETTNSDGVIPEQQILTRYWTFDPILQPDYTNYRNIALFDNNPFNLVVSMGGYETYNLVWNIEAPTALEVSLTPY